MNHNIALVMSSTSPTLLEAVYRVPKTVLQKIFIHISDEARPNLSAEVEYLDCTTVPDHSSWNHFKAFTHVCRYWRYGAEECPYLWNYVCVGSFSVGQVKTYLERSKQIPLDVEVRLVHSTPKNAAEIRRQIELLTQHGFRIRNLLVKLVCYTSLDVLLPLFESMRDVVSIRILSFPSRAVMSTLWNITPFNQLSFLRTSQFCCVHPTPELYPLFSNVIDLSLEWSDYIVCLTWHEFVTLLQAIPNLFRLKIGNYEWGEELQADVEADNIILQSLRILDLSLTKKGCLRFLRAFELSLLTQIFITCTDYHVMDYIIAPLHLFQVNTCSNLEISYNTETIVFSFNFTVFDATQQLRITLCLPDVKGLSVSRTALILGVIDNWMDSGLFNNVQYVLRSSGSITDDGWDDELEPLCLDDEDGLNSD